ncbi:hypothetical protein HAX54_034461 [Datura stramonium]|uniref:Uncharacterized protein n=1 Tax=Datura stramonium TaxID=4076 RepID=A0ABS8SEG4_DATST|nr:hypothetical protein [Datura stramonium]
MGARGVRISKNWLGSTSAFTTSRVQILVKLFMLRLNLSMLGNQFMFGKYDEFRKKDSSNLGKRILISSSRVTIKTNMPIPQENAEYQETCQAMIKSGIESVNRA